jgi:hypothetical protein
MIDAGTGAEAKAEAEDFDEFLLSGIITIN